MKEIFNIDGRRPSTFLLTTLEDSELGNQLWAMQRGRDKSVIRICRGRKMRRTEQLFDEISAAFQFPYYFGENWAALEDCFSDLSWLESDSYVMCVTSAHDLLAEEDDTSFKYFARSMDLIAKGWAGGNPNLQLLGRVPVPFHVVMQLTPGSEIKNKLQAHGFVPDLLGNQILRSANL